MKIPNRIMPLVEEGLVDEVLLQLMSGKEATVYIVSSQGEERCAKVYKEVNQRNFKHNAQYTEGRKVRNSRSSRAMGKNSKFGKKEQEDAWQNAEVKALYHLSAAGVRVPQLYDFFEGVLLMELIVDEEGNPAPRLHDVEMTKELADKYHAFMIQEIVKMLCAGLIHGDLSEYNILLGQQGPVIIDLPQAVNPASNNNAREILERDIENVKNYFGQYSPEILTTQYAKEIWDFYKRGSLTPETPLTGRYRASTQKADVSNIMRIIDDVKKEESDRKTRETNTPEY